MTSAASHTSEADSRTRTEQTLAAGRIYQIQTATDRLNRALRTPANEQLPTSDRLQFIARAWPDGQTGEDETQRSPRFYFTYFSVQNFRSAMKGILQDITGNRETWCDLVSHFSRRYSATPRVQLTVDFFTKIFDTPPDELHPDREDLRNDMHYHIANLVSSIPLDNLISGWLQTHPEMRDDATHRAYVVQLNRQQSPPGLRLSNILSQDSFTNADPPSCFQMQQYPTCFANDAQHNKFFHLVMLLTGQQETRDFMLWIPVYECSTDGRACGRFLGWLFRFLETIPMEDALASMYLRSALPHYNSFARDFVDIETTALSRLPALPSTTSYRQNPELFLVENLANWEGWESVSVIPDPNDSKENAQEKFLWWTIDDKQLKISLAPSSLDHREDWGRFHSEKLGWIALRRGANVAPERWEQWRAKSLQSTHGDAIDQVRRIRVLVRSVCHQLTNIRAAEDARVRKQVAAWTHEVKNYANEIQGILSDPTHVDTASDAARILAAVSTFIQRGFEDRLCFPTPDELKTGITNVLHFLLYWRAECLAIEKALTGSSHGTIMPPQITGFNAKEWSCSRPTFNPDEAGQIFAVALLREVVHNIRNEHVGAHGDAIDIDCNISEQRSDNNDCRIIATIEQEQHEQHDEQEQHEQHEQHTGEIPQPEPPQGIVRAQQLFGPEGLNVGNIYIESPKSGNGTTVIRKARIEWWLPQRRRGGLR